MAGIAAGMAVTMGALGLASVLARRLLASRLTGAGDARAMRAVDVTGALRTAGIVAAASVPLFLVNLVTIPANRLWYDELQSITHATRPWLSVAPSVLVNDAHGPLYYLLLKLWSALSTNDTALLLGSSLLAALATLVVHRVTERLADRRTAAIAAVLFGLCPLAVYWAAYLRMYALLMVLCPLFFAASLRLLRPTDRPALPLAALVLPGVAIVYTHASAPLFLATLSAPVLLAHARERLAAGDGWSPLRDAPLRLWLAGHAVIVAAFLPIAGNAAGTSLDHLIGPTLAEAVGAVAMFAIGPAYRGQPDISAGAAAAVAVVVACGFLDRRPAIRAMSGCVALSFCCALALSLLKPIWNSTRLFAYLAPFVAILAACRLAEWVERPRLAGPGSVAAAVVAALSVYGTLHLYRGHNDKPDDWRPVASLLREQARPGDAVVVYHLREAWALRWYLAGPRWQDGLAAAGIGPDEYARALGRGSLRPFRNVLFGYDYGRGLTAPDILVGHKLKPEDLATAERVWIVARSRDRIGRTAEALGLAGLPAEPHDGEGVRALLVTRGGAEAPAVAGPGAP